MIVEKISRETGVAMDELRGYIRKAGHRYKRYTIPKRRGGHRVIEHPAKPLKFLQRWVVRELVGALPVHECATAYRSGASIKANAEQHARNGFLVRIDFREFFPSISADNIRDYLHDKCRSGHLEYSNDDIDSIVSIVCRFDRLTIGAPSSPFISNAILFEFDSHWFERATALGCAYTRYADDVYFSTSAPNVLAGVLNELRIYLPQLPYPNLTINEEKVTFTSRKRRRMVTGLVLTPQGKVSIGHKRKRIIRSLVYQGVMHQLDANEAKRLQGLLAFIHDVEPTFIDSLKRKFGEDEILALFS